MARIVRGFTLVELIVVMGIMATVFGMATITLIGPQKRSALSSTVMTLTSDVRNQQMKAMAGEAPSGTPVPWGIRFGTDSYTLFSGNSYDPSAVTNMEIKLQRSQSFADVAFPGGVVIFAPGSGNFAGHTASADTFRLTDPDGGYSKTIRINGYGAVIELN